MASGCKSSKKGGETYVPPAPTSRANFHFVKSKTLSDILDRAEKEKKPVFVDFYTTWCTPCKMMDRDVFTDSALAQYYNENFISYKVDCEKGNGQNLAAIYNVSNYPTLVYLDHKGTILVSHGSAAYPSKMMELGKSAVNTYRSKFP